MAVNISTIISVCLYCKATTEKYVEKEFHEIYDEVGLELQLPTLVEKLLHIKLVNKDKQYLCDDCVNRLIELYDLEEHAKEEKEKEDVVELEIPTEINNVLEQINKKQSAEAVNLGIKVNLVYEKNPETEMLSNDCSERFSSKRGSSNNTWIDQASLNNDIESEQMNVESDVDGVATRYSDNHEIQTTSYIKKHCVAGPEHFPLVEKTKTITGTEIACEEFEIINDLKADNTHVESVKTKATEIDYICTDQNDLIEEYVIEEVISSGSSAKNSPNKLYEESAFEEIHIEELEEEFFQEELQSTQDAGDNIEEESNCAPEENDDTDLNLQLTDNENSLNVERRTELNKENAFSPVMNEKEQDERDETYLTEEEYLIEEISCSQEYDCVDINEYLEKVLVTKFKDLELDWDVKCKFCLEKYCTFQDLLNHSCIVELMEEQQCYCVVEGCEENTNDLQTLARHLILQHFDKLDSTPIYGRCPDCQKTFSNFMDFNKHSCCRSIKRKAGARNYCQSCNMDFQSLKRFVFHMQFHLTNHRPKICLICSALFNNSNDFFEHTQYEHKPEGAMACIKCDRFFKEKDVYDSHMELHEESKYLYACTYCPKKYTNKCGLNLHMDVYHNHKSKPLQCNYCDKEFVNNSSYRNHMKSHVPDAQVESFICSVCGLIANNSDSIKIHIESDRESTCFSACILEEILSLGYTCENCSLDFQTIKHLKQHRLSKNHNDKLFYCGICRRAFKTLRHMRNHAINHKEFEQWKETFPITRYFVCNIGQCQEFYPLWTSLYYHKKRPHKTGEDKESSKEFKCQFCQQLCTSKMSLAVHVARSHNNSNFRCPQCKQMYKTEKLLQNHIDKFHTAVKCNICYKNFKNRRNLESHNHLVHLNEKRYFCKHCNKGYFYKSERDAHENKVHPDVSYKCEICNFVTNYPKSLEIHLDKHNNQLKFKCTICSKPFGRKQLLKVHMKRHQDQKDHICSEYLPEGGCDAAFITYNLLKTHIQNKHKNPKDDINTNATAKRKRPAKKYLKVVQIEDDSMDLLHDDNDDSSSVNLHKRTSGIRINDIESEHDSVELILEEDIISEELKSDNEFIIQYDDEIVNSSE